MILFIAVVVLFRLRARIESARPALERFLAAARAAL